MFFYNNNISFYFFYSCAEAFSRSLSARFSVSVFVRYIAHLTDNPNIALQCYFCYLHITPI